MLSNSHHHCVVGLGEILWDMLPEGKQLGGAPANFAYHAQSLGAKSFVISSVGDDEPGREIFSELDLVSLNTEYIQINKEHPTGTVDVVLDETGKPDYIIHENVAWDSISFTENLQKLASLTNAVCYGTLAQRAQKSRETILNFINATQPGCWRVFDINLRQSYFDPEIIKESLSLSNCLKLNDDELPEIAKACAVSGTENDILMALLNKFKLKIIALTKGEKGSLLYSGEKVLFLGTPHLDVKDTVGAGDAFTAALVAGLLTNSPLEIIHRNANRLAAYVCTQRGATPRITPELKHKLMAV